MFNVPRSSTQEQNRCTMAENFQGNDSQNAEFLSKRGMVQALLSRNEMGDLCSDMISFQMGDLCSDTMLGHRDNASKLGFSIKIMVNIYA